jgi:protein-disulfide isomerase
MGEHKRKKSFGRRNAPKVKVTIIIIIACGVAFAAVDYFRNSNKSPISKFVPERSKGNPDAPLRILEFADFQCSHCSEGSVLLREYMEKYPQSIYLGMKYYPLGQLNSMVSALYAECAARQNKFWEYHDIIFKRQSQWRTLRSVKPVLKIMAKEANLNLAELDMCVEKDDVRSIVAAEKLMGESLRIQSTPTYFVNEEMVVGKNALRKYLEEYFIDNE